MGAPTTAYYNESIRLKNNTTTQEVKRAKYIANTSPNSGDGYFNTNDSDEVRKSKIMALFSLDKLLCSEKNGIKAFTGLVKINGINDQYHNINRKSNIRVSNGSDVYAVMNDGGLNTLGKCGVYSVLSNDSSSHSDNPNIFIPRLNNSVVYANFTSSFYDNTTSRKVQILLGTNNWADIQDFGLLNSNTSIINKTNIISDSLIGRAGIKSFRAVISNNEGIYYSPIIDAEIKRAYANMKYDPTYASYAFNGSTTKNIYYDTAIITSIQGGAGIDATTFSKNDVAIITPTDRADFGFYILNNKWYEYKYYEPEDIYAVVRMGDCTSWGWLPDDPAYRFYPEFFNDVQLSFEEATLIVTNNNSSITYGSVNNNTTPPSFPNATYSINISTSISRQFVDLYFYIIRDSSYYYIGSEFINTETSRNFSFSGNFSSLGFTPNAGDQYYIFITDTQI